VAPHTFLAQTTDVLWLCHSRKQRRKLEQDSRSSFLQAVREDSEEGEKVREYTYAQAKRGLKLHLVERTDRTHVLRRALCGKEADWRLTINLPMGMSCANCQRVYAAIYGAAYRPRLDMVIG